MEKRKRKEKTERERRGAEDSQRRRGRTFITEDTEVRKAK
jgi:hypothetical protein